MESATQSVLSSIHLVGTVKKGAKALKKAAKAVKNKVSKTKGKVKAFLKKKKKSSNKKKKKKKRGKVFTKARKLFNNLTKKSLISKLKKAMNKAALERVDFEKSCKICEG